MRPKIAMRFRGAGVLEVLAELVADVGLVSHWGVERVEKEDVEHSVTGSRRVVCEDARRHHGHG